MDEIVPQGFFETSVAIDEIKKNLQGIYNKGVQNRLPKSETAHTGRFSPFLETIGSIPGS